MGLVRKTLLLALLLSLGACAGFRPVAPERQRLFAGETSAIALPTPPPEGASLTWDPGDGSAAFQGPVLAHTWQRPGVYTVEVEGPGGSDRFEVEVQPRPVLRAIPAHARSAAAVPTAWSRFGEYADLATRFAAGSEVEGVLRLLQQKLGADPGVPAELVEVGIDPAEGLGFAIFDFDPDSTWLLVGILDEERALATAQRLFELQQIDRLEARGGRLYVGATPRGEAVAFGLVGGYLAIHSGDGSRPALREAIESFATSGAGLTASRTFLAGRALVEGDDAVLFVRESDGSGAYVAGVVGLELGEGELLARYGILLPEEATLEAEAAFQPHGEPSAALGRLPSGAVTFLSLSFTPELILSEGAPAALRGAFLGGWLERETGEPADRLLRALSGNLSAGLYFEAEAFTELLGAMMLGGSTDPDELPPLVARVELRGEEAEATLSRALAGAARATADGWWQRGPLFFRLEQGTLEVVTLRARHLRPKPQGMVDFGDRLPLTAGTQALYVDVAAIREALLAGEARTPQAALVRTLLLEETAFLEPVRAVSFHGRMVPGGTVGTLRIELQPRE